MFNNVIVEDTGKLYNLHGIVRDPTGRSMHWLASIEWMRLATVIISLRVLAYPILC